MVDFHVVEGWDGDGMEGSEAREGWDGMDMPGLPVSGVCLCPVHNKLDSKRVGLR